MTPTTCNEHSALVKQVQETREIVVAVREQNITQFKSLKELRSLMQTLQEEVHELGNGKMTRILEKVLQQQQEERKAELEVEMKEKELALKAKEAEAKKWKNYTGLATVLSPIVMKVIELLFK